MDFVIGALALTTLQPQAEPPVETEIEVIGNRLRDWRGTAKLRRGVVTCKTERSTGDKAIDAIGCDAMVQCHQPIAPQWEVINSSKLDRSETAQQFNTLIISANVGGCVVEKRKAGIETLAAARGSKRS